MRSVKEQIVLKRNKLLFAAFVVASLYDFYVGVRVFDVLALVLVSLAFFPEAKGFVLRSFRAPLRLPPPSSLCAFVMRYPVAVFFGGFSLIGLASFAHPSSLVLLALMGVGVFLARQSADGGRAVLRIVPYLILAHALLLIGQIIAHHAFGFTLDYLSLTREFLSQTPLGEVLPKAWLDLPRSRIVMMSSDYHSSRMTMPVDYYTSYFRPSGLFQEPNNYCETMVLLTLSIVRLSSWTWLRYLTYGLMILTQSMYGAGAALILFLFDAILNNRKKDVLYATAFGVVVWGVAVQAGLLMRIDALARLPKIFSDTSFVERYIGLDLGHKLGLIGRKPVLDHCALPSLPFSFFGIGLSNAYFEYCVAKNGIAQLLYAMGVSFVPFVFLSWTTLHQGRRWKEAAPIALGVGVMLLSYPFYTYVFFWLWLGLMLSATSPSNGEGGGAFKVPFLGVCQKPEKSA